MLSDLVCVCVLGRKGHRENIGSFRVMAFRLEFRIRLSRLDPFSLDRLEALESITCTISGNGNGRRLAQSCADANADVRYLCSSAIASCDIYEKLILFIILFIRFVPAA